MILRRRTPFLVAALSALAATLLLLVSRRLDDTRLLTREMNPSARRRLELAQKVDFLHGFELILYDWRVRQAAQNGPPLDSRLGLLVIDNGTIEDLRRGLLIGEPLRPLWRRDVYARALRELRSQGAHAVAFDILMGEHYEDTFVPDGTTNTVHADRWLASEIRQSGNVFMGATAELGVAPMFWSAAAGVGDVDSPKDVDGSARRVRAFTEVRGISLDLQLALRAQKLEYLTPKELEVRGVEVGTNALNVVHLETGEFSSLPIETNGTVLVPRGRFSVEVPVFQTVRMWHLGILLAASELGLRLDRAEVGPEGIVLGSTNGITRTIPTDSGGYFMIDWNAAGTNETKLFQRPLSEVIAADTRRNGEPGAEIPNHWAGKLVLVGSTATGNNLTDFGATPLAAKDYLISTYPNVANSILTGRFVRRWPMGAEVALTALLTLAAACITWQIRPGLALLAVLAVAALYFVAAFWAFHEFRIWIPVAHPLAGALAIAFPAMVTYRAVFAQREQQRVKSVFSKIVSPNVVQELLKAERLGLEGARRKVTVFFADVRGFTEMTDRYQADAEAHVREKGLSEEEAELHFESQAGEVLRTVNLYLAAIADVVKFHNGTLDKYIGDCVMAFWGAPAANPSHAVHAVIAAIDAQRAVARLNEARAVENEARAKADPQAAPLPLLALGTGINTGTVTVGLMGSEAHILNYTVFGREVNLASRLEGVSGRSRVIIGEETYLELRRNAPALAATCIGLEAVTVKGFRQPVTIYEVPWQQATDEASRISELYAPPVAGS